MVAKFRWKCKTSEGTLTQLTDAMDPSDLHKLDITDGNDDSTSLPDHIFVENADLNKDETDMLELSKSTSCIEEIISPIADDLSEQSANEYDDVEDGESGTVLLKREIYEEIEYLQSDCGKNEGQQPAKDQLHYVIDDTGNSEAVQYIIMESPSHHTDDSFHDINGEEGNDVEEQSDEENVISHSGKEVKPKILSEFLIYYRFSILCIYWMQQYEIIISDVVDYDGDGVSNEADIPNEYFGNDGKLLV